jgi:hypothetical protein
MEAHTLTRVSLHGVAEGVLAGPQLRESGTIRLRVLQGGFATTREPLLRVAGTDLVLGTGERIPMTGTFQALAEAAGVAFGPPGIYADHAPVAADDDLLVDEAAAARIAAWFERGRQALASFAPAETPVLWPEHFDLAITAREVNYGVSPGDGFLAEPYAYVGPWSFDAPSPFWNAPFGAVRTAAELPSAESMARFFRNGQEQAARLQG